MTTIDLIVLAIIAVSMVVGFFRGLFPELIGLGTWVVAGVGAMQFSDVLLPYLSGKMGSPTVELWSARAAMFVALMIVGGLVGQLVSLVVDKAGLSGTDKALGMIFGAVRGVVIIGALVIFGQLIGFQNDSWWSDSTLISFGEGVADALRAILPEQLASYLEPSAPVESGGAATLDSLRDALDGVAGGNAEDASDSDTTP
ncbi:MAG: CvpA family protein [Pseudomonadota bacterium]